MKKSSLAFSILALVTTNSIFALNLAVSPTSMDWSDQGFVEANLSGLGTSARVYLKIFADIDGDGILDATDPLAVQFELQDGHTNAFGATTFVDDNDGVANGAITTAVSFFGNNYLKSAGDYVWQAIELDGAGIPIATNTATFSIIQPASTTWITGEVREYGSMTLIPGAYVELQYFSDTAGTAPSTWTDENGEFSIQLPAGVAANEIWGAFAAAPGHLSAKSDPDGNLISLGVFTNGLVTGENALSQPLFVVPSVPQYGLVDLSGTVYLVEGNQTNTLAGAMVEIEYPSFGDEEGPDIHSFDISAEDGSFSLVFSQAENEWDTASLNCANAYLTMRGMVPTPINNLLINGSTNGISLYCHLAEAMVSGTVSNALSGDPIVGVEVELTAGNDLIGSAYTLNNGLYEVGLLTSTSYDAQCANDSLEKQHFVRSNQGIGYRYVSNLYAGEIRDEQDLSYTLGALILGHVYTESGSPLPGGTTILVEPSEEGWENRIQDTFVAVDGHYTLLAAPGIWNIRTENFDGPWIDLYYTNVQPFSLDMPTPIIVSNANVGGIDFYLEEGTRLIGSVQMPDSSTAGDIQMEAFQLNAFGEPELVGASRTGWDEGRYEFVVPSGKTTYLRANSDGWQTPDTWLGNTGARALSTTINPVVGTTMTNLDIHILAGYQIQIAVKDQFDESTLNPLTAFALDSSSNQYGSAIEQWDSWNIFVPTNTPLTFYAEAAGYEGEFITNTYNFADADYFQRSEGTFLHLDFVLHSSTRDTDGDGLLDYIEDSHPDGIPEPSDVSNPLLADSDNDGADDNQEYYAGTDAWDANSIFKVTEAIPAGSNLSLRWSSVPGREYTVQFSPDLASGSWSNIHTVVATGMETTYSPTTAASTHRYYQVRVETP